MKFHVVKRMFGKDLVLAQYSSGGMIPEKQAFFEAAAYLQGYVQALIDDGKKHYSFQHPVNPYKDGLYYKDAEKDLIFAVYVEYDYKQGKVGRIAKLSDIGL